MASRFLKGGLRQEWNRLKRSDLIGYLSRNRMPHWENGAELLKKFIEKGYKFNPQAKGCDGVNEVMFIAAHIGVEGVKIFREYGGAFDAEAQDSNGKTELEFIEGAVIKRLTGASVDLNNPNP